MDIGIYYGSLQSWLVTIKIPRLKKHHRKKLSGISEHVKSISTIGPAPLRSWNLQEARNFSDGLVMM